MVYPTSAGQLFAHITGPESLILAAAFLLGVLAGGLASWWMARLWLRHDR